MSGRKHEDKFDFGKAYRELEELIEWFEKGEADLDQGLKKFERGLDLASKCRARLKQAENRIVEIKAKFGQGADDADSE